MDQGFFQTSLRQNSAASPRHTQMPSNWATSTLHPGTHLLSDLIPFSGSAVQPLDPIAVSVAVLVIGFGLLLNHKKPAG